MQLRMLQLLVPVAQRRNGFWAGTPSFARLINGLAVTNETVRDDPAFDDIDSDEEPMTAAELRASAHEDYPMLDS